MTEEIKKENENININIDNTKNEEENKNQNIDNKITIEEENENFLNKIILNKYKIIKKIRRGLWLHRDQHGQRHHLLHVHL